MANQLTKEQIVERVQKLISGDWDEQQMITLFLEISENVPCPYAEIQGYVFHAKDNPTAEIIVERMLAHRCIQL